MSKQFLLGKQGATNFKNFLLENGVSEEDILVADFTSARPSRDEIATSYDSDRLTSFLEDATDIFQYGFYTPLNETGIVKDTHYTVTDLEIEEETRDLHAMEYLRDYEGFTLTNEAALSIVLDIHGTERAIEYGEHNLEMSSEDVVDIIKELRANSRLDKYGPGHDVQMAEEMKQFSLPEACDLLILKNCSPELAEYIENEHPGKYSNILAYNNEQVIFIGEEEMIHKLYRDSFEINGNSIAYLNADVLTNRWSHQAYVENLSEDINTEAVENRVLAMCAENDLTDIQTCELEQICELDD